MMFNFVSENEAFPIQLLHHNKYEFDQEMQLSQNALNPKTRKTTQMNGNINKEYRHVTSQTQKRLTIGLPSWNGQWQKWPLGV